MKKVSLFFSFIMFSLVLAGCQPTPFRLPSTIAGKPIQSVTVEDLKRIRVIDNIKKNIHLLKVDDEDAYEFLINNYGHQLSEEVIQYLVD